MHLKSSYKKKRSGQAMLIAVLSLGGAILGATAIAGFLTLYQIRTSNDSQNSAMALFAADSGLEWAQYNYYCGVSTGVCSSDSQKTALAPAYLFLISPTLNVSSVCYDAVGNNSPCSSTASTTSVISTGVSLDAERVFFLEFANATLTYP